MEKITEHLNTGPPGSWKKIEVKMSESDAEDDWSRDSVALRLVFTYLDARELCRVARVSRGWREAARDCGVWRGALRGALLRRGVAAGEVAPALRGMRAGGGGRDWRGECARACAPWRLERAMQAVNGQQVSTFRSWVNLVLHCKVCIVWIDQLFHDSFITYFQVWCAALCSCGSRLAIGGAEGDVQVWEAREGGWAAAGRAALGARWAGVRRARWAADCTRVLVAGRLALSARWELAVCGAEGGVRLRGAVGAGGAACWAAGGGALLALSGARVAAARGAARTLWLYAATLHAQDAHAGVAAPLMHVWSDRDARLR